MSRRKKDPLRPLTDAERAGPDPAQPVPGRPRRPGRPGHHAPGRRRAATTTRRPPAPPAAAPATPSPIWSPASTPRAWPPCRPATAAADRPPTTRRRGSGSSREVERTPTPEADGTATWSLEHLAKGVAVGPRRPARASRPTPSGRCSTRPATATSAPAPGAPPAPPCAAARPGRRSSPTPTPSQKKVDRGRLPPGRGDGPVGLVRRPGRAVPDGPASRASPGGPRASRRGSRTSTSATARPRS